MAHTAKGKHLLHQIATAFFCEPTTREPLPVGSMTCNPDSNVHELNVAMALDVPSACPGIPDEALKRHKASTLIIGIADNV